MPLLVHRFKLSPQAEKNYAAALKNLSTHYYDGQSWLANRNAGNANTHLVEFWENQGKIEHHESRNPFNWVQDDQVKLGWHQILMQSIQFLKTGRGHGGAASSSSSSSPSSSHPLDIPTTLKEKSLIGYTSAQPTKPVLIKFNSEYQPSVYYREGHYTRDHSETDNLGWKDKSKGWMLLCFANVPVQYLNENYVPEQPVRVNLGGLKTLGGAMFPAGDVDAYIVSQTGKRQPTTYNVRLVQRIGGQTLVEVPDDSYPVPGHHASHRIHAN